MVFSKLKSLFKKSIKVADPAQASGINIGIVNNLKSAVFKSQIKDEKNKSNFDWFGDRYQSLIIQRNISIFLLVVSIFCVAFTGISLAVITKSKTIEPFVIEVESNQGLVTYIDNNNQRRRYTQDEALRNYFVKRYIEARETFDTRNYNYFYHKVVRFMSDDKVYKQFITLLRSGNKDNPVKYLDGNESSKIVINSITILKEKVLQVRFVVEAKFGDGSTIRANRVAILEYDYYDVGTEEEKRYINPLNFIITSYRATDENT